MTVITSLKVLLLVVSFSTKIPNLIMTHRTLQSKIVVVLKKHLLLKLKVLLKQKLVLNQYLLRDNSKKNSNKKLILNFKKKIKKILRISLKVLMKMKNIKPML